MTDYKDIASFYDLWSLGDPIANSCKQFYVELCLQEKGKVVELGVGTGRIAVEIAQNGKFITGVDSCNEMLSVFQQKAKDISVLHNIELINSDVLNFNLHEKANLITFPFRSIGHVLTLKAKEKLFENIFKQLKTNGLFVFDHYVFDKSWAETHNGITRLMYQSIKNGEGVFIWDTYLYDYEHQLMNCFVTYEETTNQNIVKLKKIVPFKFSWVYPEQIKELAEKTGFNIVDIYGDFNRKGFNNKSNNQIWFLRK